MHAKKLDEFLTSATEVGKLVPLAAEHLDIGQALRNALPASVRGLYQIARVKQGKVVIFAESNAIAAKLRLLEPTIVAELGRRGADVTGIEVRVQAEMPRTPHFHDRRARLSPAAGQALDTLADRLPPSPLRDAVRALARKAR
ncbi:MAG: DciA family protein [Burkholderiales bacterium]|nr:DciA family protein [Burkholderiales bacterium]